MAHRPAADIGTRRTRVALGVLGAVAATAIAARLSFPVPGAAAPQSAQTLTVLVAGALLGLRWGAFSMVLYVALSALGLPLLADGRGGIDAVTGPSAGYLLGFVIAAGWMGWALRVRRSRTWVQASTAALVGHAIILLLGALRLAASMGLGPAVQAGLVPFLWGGAIKSIVAGGMIVGLRWVFSSRRPSPAPTP